MGVSNVFFLLFVGVLLFVLFSFSASNILLPFCHLCDLNVQSDCEKEELSSRHRAAMAPSSWFVVLTSFCLSDQKKAARNIYRPATTAMTATRNPARIQPNTAPAQADWPEASNSDANTCEWSW